MVADKQRTIQMAMVSLIVLALLLTGGPGWCADTAEEGWSGYFGVGVLGNTTDGTAFAFNMAFDRFVTRNISLGPLFQLGATGDLVQTGFSGQAKFWMDLARGEHPLRLALQAGIGFVQADHRSSDTSWLFPIGAEVDFGLTKKLHLAGNFLLNFTDLDTGGGADTSIMPGFTVGLRF